MQYTARTSDGKHNQGTAEELLAWLQAQDWHWGGAGPPGASGWRQAVAARIAVQTGREMDVGVVQSEDADAFLLALASAGLLTLSLMSTQEGTNDANKGET